MSSIVDRNTRLAKILDIGHDTSMRGAGISLREALAVTGYAEYRSSFTAVDLLPIIGALVVDGNWCRSDGQEMSAPPPPAQVMQL
jgi:hypothetical protein